MCSLTLYHSASLQPFLNTIATAASTNPIPAVLSNPTLPSHIFTLIPPSNPSFPPTTDLPPKTSIATTTTTTTFSILPLFLNPYRTSPFQPAT